MVKNMDTEITAAEEARGKQLLLLDGDLVAYLLRITMGPAATAPLWQGVVLDSAFVSHPMGRSQGY